MSPRSGVTHPITIEDVDGTNRLGLLYVPVNGAHPYSLFHAETIRPRQLTMGELTKAEFPPDISLFWPQEKWNGGIGGINHRTHPLQLQDAVMIDSSGTDEVMRLPPRVTQSAMDAGETDPADLVPCGFATTGDQQWGFFGREPHRWDFSESAWDESPINASLNAASIIRNAIPFNGTWYAPRWADDSAGGGHDAADDLPSIYVFKSATGTTWTNSTLANDAIINDAFKYFAEAAGVLYGGNTVTITDSTTNLNEDLDTSETGVDVVDGSVFAAGDVIRIDAEYMLVTSISTNTLTVTRGYRGTAGRTHSNTQNVYDIVDRPNAIRSTTDGGNSGTWSGETLIGGSSEPITALLGRDDDLIICKTTGIFRLESNGKVTELDTSLRATAHPDNYRGAVMVGNKAILPLGAGGLLQLDFDTFEITDISPAKMLPNLSAYTGKVIPIACDPNIFFALILESGNTRYHLFKVEFLTIDDETKWRWHHFNRVSYTTATDEDHAAGLVVGMQGDGSPGDIHHRLWFGIESTGAGSSTATSAMPYFMPLDGTDANFLINNDLSNPFALTTVYDKNLSHVQGRYQSVRFRTENLGTSVDTAIDTAEALDTTETGIDMDADPTSAILVNDIIVIDSERMLVTASATGPNLVTVTRGYAGSTAATHSTNADIFTINYIEMRYRTDGGSLAFITGSQSTSTLTTSPQTLTFSSGITGRTLELRPQPRLGTGQTINPGVLEFTVTSQLRADTVELIPVRTILRDGQMMLNGRPESGVQDKLTQIRIWRSQTAEVIATLADVPHGVTAYTCVFLPNSYKQTMLTRQRGRRPSYLIEFVLANVG